MFGLFKRKEPCAHSFMQAENVLNIDDYRAYVFICVKCKESTVLQDIKVEEILAKQRALDSVGYPPDIRYALRSPVPPPPVCKCEKLTLNVNSKSF